MKVDAVVARLVSCGLAEKEARALAHLTHLGKSKVTDLAAAAGLKRAETYQILERLQSRGLVEATLERPRLFTAVAAQRATEILVEEREHALKEITAVRDDLTQRLRQLGGGVAEAASESFRVLHDRNQIGGQLGRTIRAAATDLCVVASGRSLFRLLLDEGLDSEFRAAAKRGVKVRVLTELLEGQEDVRARLGEFAEVRHLMVPRPLRFFIADEREIVQFVTTDPLGGTGKETALWLGARDHVQAQRAFFDDLWAGAMSAAARGEELRTGRAPEQVRLVNGRFTRYEKEKELLLRAEREIALLLPGAEADRFARSGVLRVVEAKLRDGVRVRVLVPRGSALRVPGAEVREAELTRELPVTLADHAEALLAFPSEAEPARLTGVDECAVWVTVGPSVQSLWAAFESLWVGARAAHIQK